MCGEGQRRILVECRAIEANANGVATMSTNVVLARGELGGPAEGARAAARYAIESAQAEERSRLARELAAAFRAVDPLSPFAADQERSAADYDQIAQRSRLAATALESVCVAGSAPAEDDRHFECMGDACWCRANPDDCPAEAHVRRVVARAAGHDPAGAVGGGQ